MTRLYLDDVRNPPEDGGGPDDLLIWWLSRADQEALGEPRDGWPDYLRREYISRYGRAGRGRLWAAPELGHVSVAFPLQDTPLSSALEKCGGIVIRASDAHHLEGMPGIITDLALLRWSAPLDARVAALESGLEQALKRLADVERLVEDLTGPRSDR